MFGIGGWEFMLIAVLALLLFGPDKLPQFARTIGRFMRDFKRYQDLMESTIRGEIFAADPSLQKDQFKTGKEFREKVAGGGFSKPEPKAEAPESEEVSESAADGEIAVDADQGVPVPVASPADVEAAPDVAIGEHATTDGLEAITEDGEGERDEA
ncbi:MAG: twin-arginine translocase TatA/TatE family subunit [Coriobacteriia bacterium]|nr:twin-arginine translocase TatA/TatE family subunit [Coriobacteriia bacterium]